MLKDSNGKSTQYRGIFKVKKSRKAWHMLQNWSQQLEYMQVRKRNGARYPEAFPAAMPHSLQCSMEICRNSVKVKSGIKRKGRNLTQSYEKAPIPSENDSQEATQRRNQNLDYTTIADRLRTVSWSN